MQPWRHCGTLHCDSHDFCLSTLLLTRNRSRRERKNVMWQRLSLRGRINLLLALVLAAGLAVNVARLALEAAPRVQAEDQSVTRLARELVETMVVGLGEMPDPEARLNQIIEDLKRLRHISITRPDDQTSVPVEDGDDAHSVPSWFVALVHPEKTSVSVPVSLHGQSSALLITSL